MPLWHLTAMATLVVLSLSIALPANLARAQTDQTEPMTIIFERPPGSALTLAELVGGSLTVTADMQFCAEVTIDADTVAVQIGASDQQDACRVPGAAITFRAADGVELLRTFDFTAGAEVVLNDFERVPQPSTPGFSPEPSGRGVHLAMWSGGTVEQAAAAVPDTVSLWLTVEGRFVGYIVGAPDFVNAAFIDLTAGGHIDPQSPMLVVLSG